MHIGIDAQRLAGQRLGVGRYIEYLVRHWRDMLGPEDRVTLFVRDRLPDQDAFSLPGFHVRHLRPRLTGQLWQNLVLPPHARDVDVLFGPSYTVPVTRRGTSVVAIHSVNEVEAGAHPRWYHLTYSALYRRSAHRAVAVIAPSESVRQDLADAYGVSAEKIAVVPQGADEAFRPLEDPDVIRETRVRYLGEDRPYVVFVGKLSQRRSIPTLLRAFAILKRREGFPHALLLMGPNHEDLPLPSLIEELGLEGDVFQTDGRVSSHLELVPVYGAADLYVNASLYEGFSMTLVEALSCGTPVVAMNRGSLPEIAGDAAVLVNEPTPTALADAMASVLSDPALRGDLRRRSVERARLFRWDMTARRTLEILRRVASKEPKQRMPT